MRGNTALILEHYQKPLKDPMLKEMVTDIHESSLRLINIVNDFLDMSRLEQGKVVIHTTDVDVIDLAGEVMHDFEQMAKTQHIFVKVDAPDKNVVVATDSDRVK